MRRTVVTALVATVIAPGLASAQSTPIPIEVWKGPTCSCCKDWIAHLKDNGFQVTVHDIGNTAMRGRLKIPVKLGSCHTALVHGYAIEGHVPAKDILRLLKERPDAIGLTVPGMPIGAPGMDGPAYGPRRDPYDTLLVAKDGGSSVYQSHR